MSRGQKTRQDRLSAIATVLVAEPTKRPPQELDLNIAKLRAEADSECWDAIRAAMQYRDDVDAMERVLHRLSAKQTSNGNGQTSNGGAGRSLGQAVVHELTGEAEVVTQPKASKLERQARFKRKSDYRAMERVILFCLQSEPIRPWNTGELIERIRHLARSPSRGSHSQAVRAIGARLARKGLAVEGRDRRQAVFTATTPPTTPPTTHVEAEGISPAALAKAEAISIAPGPSEAVTTTMRDIVISALIDLKEARPNVIAQWIMDKGLNHRNHNPEKMTSSVRWTLQDLHELKMVRRRIDPSAPAGSNHTLFSLQPAAAQKRGAAVKRQVVADTTRSSVRDGVLAALLAHKEMSPSEISRWMAENGMNPHGYNQERLSHHVNWCLRKLRDSGQVTNRPAPLSAGLGNHKRVAYSLKRPSIKVTKEEE